MSLIVYDKDRQQRQITGWKEVTNNNLHALRQTGADFAHCHSAAIQDICGTDSGTAPHTRRHHSCSRHA